MSAPAFQHHRQAALALLAECPDLTRKVAGMLGHFIVTELLSPKQRASLEALLEQKGLPPLAS